MVAHLLTWLRSAPKRKLANLPLFRTVLLHFICLLCLCLLLPPAATAAKDALPSWNDGATKSAIIEFVGKVTKKGSKDYVPTKQRVAVFDNDGTLWAEQPAYFQLLYAIDRVKQLAPEHPEWKTLEPFASILKGNMKAALAGGEESVLKIVAATHAGITTEEFSHAVQQWLNSARHPKTNRPFKKMVYQPMLELLDYLRANDFKTYIVSGGGVDFMRVFAEQVYGIPPEQVIGSRIEEKFEVRNGRPVIMRLSEISFIDDKEGKPVGIHQHIGRRPIFAAGNSDGDYQMLQWTTASDGPHFGLLVHHTDAEREWAYDRESAIGKLDKGLDNAETNGWQLIDMQRDWKVVFEFDQN